MNRSYFVEIDRLEAWLARRTEQRTLNLTAVARRLGTTTAALLAAVKKGEIRATKATNGRTWLLEWSSVESWHSSRALEEDWLTIPQATERFNIEEHYRRYWGK